MANAKSAAQKSVSASEAGKEITLAEYVQQAKVNPGLVASYKFEAKARDEQDVKRTSEEWAKELAAQSQKVY